MKTRKGQKTVSWMGILCLCLALALAASLYWGYTQHSEAERLRTQVLLLTPGTGTGLETLDAAAVYDGGSISVEEAREAYTLLASYYLLLGMDETDFAAEVKQEVLEGLVEERILEKKAREAGVYTLTDAQKKQLEDKVQAQFDEQVEYYSAYRQTPDKNEEQVRCETIAYLEENGISLSQMQKDALENAWKDNLYEYVTANVTLDDATVKAFYETQCERDEMVYSASWNEYETDAEAGRVITWHPSGVRRIDTILIVPDREPGAENIESTEADYSALEPAANLVLQRLADGESFESLKQEYGTLTTEGCYISESSVLYGEEFTEAAMTLQETGALSGPVRTPYGICVLRYRDDVKAGKVDFELVRDALAETCRIEMASGKYNETVENWLKEANIIYYTDRF